MEITLPLVTCVTFTLFLLCVKDTPMSLTLGSCDSEGLALWTLLPKGDSFSSGTLGGCDS